MIAKTIEELLLYSKVHLGLENQDFIFTRNLLLTELFVEEPYFGNIDKEKIKSMIVPDELTEELRTYLHDNLHYNDKRIESEIAYIYGLLSPLPSKTIYFFNRLFKNSPSDATDYLYDLSIKNNYVQKSKVDQNIHWDACVNKLNFEISINLSKPEKDNKDIAKIASTTSINYPKCVICIENEGCAGSSHTPPRGNLRLIPLKLNYKKWYLQYSPYGYYEEHCIVIFNKHVPMKVCQGNLHAQFDFVDMFPHYFLGSNADLPIVGGSILNHEHFQGGKHIMPLMKASVKEEVKLHNYPNNKLYLLNWPSLTLLAEGKDKFELLNMCNHIKYVYEKYSDPSIQLISNTDETRHNTLDFIVRKEKDLYKVFIIFRNNRCDETHPGGIFHVRSSLWNIKKEGIGLIEAMGLFVLPARLKRQLALVDDIANNKINEKESIIKYPDLVDFKEMISDIRDAKYKDSKDYVNHACYDILCDISVFKFDDDKRRGYLKFIKELDL